MAVATCAKKWPQRSMHTADLSAMAAFVGMPIGGKELAALRCPHGAGLHGQAAAWLQQQAFFELADLRCAGNLSILTGARPSWGLAPSRWEASKAVCVAGSASQTRLALPCVSHHGSMTCLCGATLSGIVRAWMHWHWCACLVPTGPHRRSKTTRIWAVICAQAKDVPLRPGERCGSGMLLAHLAHDTLPRCTCATCCLLFLPFSPANSPCRGSPHLKRT